MIFSKKDGFWVEYVCIKRRGEVNLFQTASRIAPATHTYTFSIDKLDKLMEELSLQQRI